jgi:hypothetical protein
MNWDAIGAVGEIVGAIAVIASLLYLSIQIRTSNRAVKQASGQELMGAMREYYSQVSKDSAIAELWIKGSTKPESMTKSEALQHGLLITQAIILWERMLHLEESGDVDEWFLHHTTFARDNAISSEGFRYWYNERSEQVSPKMRKVIERVLAENRSYSLLGDSYGTSNATSGGKST